MMTASKLKSSEIRSCHGCAADRPPGGNTGGVPPTTFHPDLRRVARYIPKQIVTPVTVPFLRAANPCCGARRPKTSRC